MLLKFVGLYRELILTPQLRAQTIQIWPVIGVKQDFAYYLVSVLDQRIV